MAIDLSAATYKSGRRALELATDGGGSSNSIQEMASLLAQEALDHGKSSYSDPYNGFRTTSCIHHTALEVAAAAGHVDAVDRLLAAGADPNAPVHRMGTSALGAAAAQGQLFVVRKLLAAGAHTSTDYSERGLADNPLKAAASAGHVEICEVLMQHGADVSRTIELVQEAWGITLLDLFLGLVDATAREFDPDELEVAMAERRHEESGRLLRTKDFLDRAQKSMDRALEAVAATGNMLLLQRLLDAGAAVLGPSEYVGPNPIDAAASGGHLEAMNKLLQTASDRHSPLHKKALTDALQSVMEGGNAAMIEPLLQHGADAQRIEVQEAAARGHLDVLIAILQSGARLKTIRGITALHQAAYHGHQDVVDFLLDKGVDINECVDKIWGGGEEMEAGTTALQLAVLGGDLALTKRLVDAGASVDASRHGADTALQAAVRTGDTAMLELLLAAGANVNIVVGGTGDVSSYWSVKGKETYGATVRSDPGENRPVGCRRGRQPRPCGTDAFNDDS